MIQFYETEIKNIALHFVGNKNNDEYVKCSKSILNLDEITRDVLMNYFIKPFAQKQDYYALHHNIDLSMNEVFVCISNIFDNSEQLQEQSKNLAKHLYEQSTHPKIKGGEFYTVYFKNCIIDDQTVDAIGLFKSENKDTFLKISPSGEDFEIESEKGVNVNKLDKGCLIFNTEREKGYVVTVVDNTNKGSDAQYWIDDFLNVRQRKDEYYNTQNILSLCKNFVKDELSQQSDISKADQVDFLNKSMKFFKENENFNMNEFANEVIGRPEIIESFNQYKSSFQKDFDVEIADKFSISESAVKKQARSLKSIIKLDKNFDIYIHGGRELIEQGEDNKGKFYKVYYKEES